MPNDANDDRLMTRGEVSTQFGISVRYLEDLAAKGQGPAYSKFNRMVRYKASDVRAWINQNKISAGQLYAPDLALRVMTALRKGTQNSKAGIDALIAETDAACEALAKQSLEIADARKTGPKLGADVKEAKAEFSETRATEAGFEGCLKDLRRLAAAL